MNLFLKAQVLIVITCFVSISVYSQSSDTLTQTKIIVRGEPGTKELYPLMIARFTAEKEIELDSISIKKINPNWIKRTELYIDGHIPNEYGEKGKDGIVLIYFKRRKEKKIIEILHQY